MRDEIDTIIDGILENEGWPRYTNNPLDKGGPTKGGITLDTLERWRKRSTSADDVAALEELEVRAIYRAEYVSGPGFDLIEDEQLRFNVIDAGVLHGQAWATRRLQEVAGVTVDGIAGPITLQAVNAASARRLNLLFTARRALKIARIVRSDARERNFNCYATEFLVGWMVRTVHHLEAEADQSA